VITFTITEQVPGKKSGQVMIPALRRIVPKAAYKAYQRQFGAQIPAEARNKFNDRTIKLGIKCMFYCKDRITVRDIVNMEQSVWDCLQDYGVIADDAQFYESANSKNLDKENPRVEISIWELDCEKS
jgi:Holliday junction resolvase RusA-like endonuclease